MSATSPGPWEVVGRYVRTARKHGGVEVASVPLDTGIDDKQRAADVRLICAAPDLLEALKALGGKRGCWCAVIYPHGQHEPACEVVRAAVAKAED